MTSSRLEEVRDYAFADQVLALRKRAGLTQHELADMLGVSTQSIHAWEAGLSYPGTDRLKQIIALYVDRGVFAVEREEVEASALWAAVREKASRRTLPFDTTWFASIQRSGGAERPPERPPTNLPPARTTFIGRAAEVTAILEALDSDAHADARLLTLTGVAGCGKTRLALAVSSMVVDAYRDGVWLVELATLPASPDADPTPVVAATLIAIGLQEQPGEAPIDTLGTHLQKRRVMLVLDHCEHAMAACAALVTHLLRACPQLQILATNQHALGGPHETTLGVSTFPVPDAVDGEPAPAELDRLRRSEAVRLFMERAQAAQPGFSLGVETVAGVATICRYLDGLPLAIELVAARVNDLPLEGMLTQLEDLFRQPHRAGNTDVDGHQILQSTLDWSYGLLDEADQAVVRRLAVFTGGWDLAAAEAVCAGDSVRQEAVLEILDELAERSLVHAHVIGGVPRYGMLESVRQHVLQQLERAGETIATRDGHLAWCAALAEHASTALLSRDQVAWLARLDREHDNLRAAMEWSLHRGPSAQGLRMAAGLWQFWRNRGHLSEGRRWLATFLSLAPDNDVQNATSVAVRASVLEGAAWLAEDQHEFDQASSLFAQSIALLRTLGREGQMSGLLINAAIQARGDENYGSVSGAQPADARQAALETTGISGVAPLGINVQVKDALSSHRFYSGFGSAFKLVPVRAYGDAEFAKAFAEFCPDVDCRPRKDAGIIYNIISRRGQRARLEVTQGHPEVPADVHETDMVTAKVSLRLEVESLAEIIRTPAYQQAAKRAVTNRGGFVKSYNWGTIEAPVRDPDGVVIIFVVHWDPRKEEEIKQALSEVRPKGSIRWIDERTVTEFPEPS